jgi:hypothetical protein
LPTYRSTSSEVKHLDNISFRPGEVKEVKNYFNLNEYPFLVKENDSPDILHPFKSILENISAISNMSETLTIIGQTVLKVTDNLECSDADEIVLTVFGGDSDIQSDFIPLSIHKFIRISQKDISGVTYPYWVCKYGIDSGFTYENNFVKPFRISNSDSCFITVAVTSISVGGSVDIHIKSWG